MVSLVINLLSSRAIGTLVVSTTSRCLVKRARAHPLNVTSRRGEWRLRDCHMNVNWMSDGK